MASFTTKITVTWPTQADRQRQAQLLLAAKTQFLNRQIAQGLTDGVAHNIDTVSSYALYTDEAGANDFGNFLIYGCGQVSTPAPTFVVSPV